MNGYLRNGERFYSRVGGIVIYVTNSFSPYVNACAGVSFCLEECIGGGGHKLEIKGGGGELETTEEASSNIQTDCRFGVMFIGLYIFSNNLLVNANI